MLRSEAVAEIQRILGFRLDNSSDIIEELKRSQEFLESSLRPWFLLKERQPLTATANQQTVALPSDFIGPAREPADDLFLQEDDGSLTALERVFQSEISGIETAKPECYALRVSDILLYPIPDQNYNLLYTYFAKDSVLDTDIENKWLKYAPYVLIGEAGKRIASALRSDSAFQVFAQMLSDAAIALRQREDELYAVHRQLTIGGED